MGLERLIQSVVFDEESGSVAQANEADSQDAVQGSSTSPEVILRRARKLKKIKQKLDEAQHPTDAFYIKQGMQPPIYMPPRDD